ncbi:MAG TPA: hypothetical protein VIJ83_04960, partial [Solirubrobacteraceae bacterium]
RSERARAQRESAARRRAAEARGQVPGHHDTCRCEDCSLGTAKVMRADLALLLDLLPDLQGLTPARVELSLEDGRVVAQIMADRIAVPLAGAGEDAPAALRELVLTVERAAKAARRRRAKGRRAR